MTSQKLVIAVGTKSALKIRAVKTAFEGFGYADASIHPYAVKSGVSDQPIGQNVMLAGAQTRAHNASKLHPNAIYCIGIENGLVELSSRYFDVACVYISAGTGESGTAFSAFFPIPQWMGKEATFGNTELGEIVKSLAGGGEKDPMKYLSQGAMWREQSIANAVQYALVPLLHASRYEKPR